MDLVAQLKRLGSDTVAYGLGAALQKFIVFLLFPIYARLLTPADFGAQDLVSTLTAVLSVLLVLGLDSGVVLHYYEASSDDQHRIRSTWVWSQVVVSIPVVVVLLAFAEPASRVLFARDDLAPYVRLAALALPFGQIVRALSLVLRLEFRARAFVVLTTLGVVFQVAAAVLLVVVWRRGVMGVFEAFLVAALLQSLVAIFMVPGAIGGLFDRTWLRRMLEVGLPLVPVALSVWVLNYANRYFLVRYVSLEEIGILSVALRISSILLFAISAFETAWGPFAYSLARNPDAARETYSKVLTYFLAAVMPAVAALSLGARELTRWLATPAYEAGAVLVPLYCLSSVSWVLLYIVGMGTGIAKKTYHSAFAMVLAAGVNIALNLLLIPLLGILGAALATLGANLVGLIYMYAAGQHYFRVSYAWRPAALAVATSLMAIGIGVAVDRQFPTWRAPVLGWKVLAAALPLASAAFLLRSFLGGFGGVLREKH